MATIAAARIDYSLNIQLYFTINAINISNIVDYNTI